jgi:hypothetical protein
VPDSDTHPYASVAGSEVRLVCPNLSPAESHAEGIFRTINGLPAVDALFAECIFAGAKARIVSEAAGANHSPAGYVKLIWEACLT